MAPTIETTTRSDVIAETPAREPGTRTALTLVLSAADLTIAPARHFVDDIDTVELGRGTRATTRDRWAGGQRLRLLVPDPFLSKDHGRMVRLGDRWLIESPSSKNGVAVNGRTTRSSPVELGDVIEVGHCLFVLERVAAPADAPLDQLLDPESHLQPLLASLHPDLVAAELALQRIARSSIPVQLHGETGTGKEVYARALHDASRRAGAFVAVNCGALPATLVESELFGSRKGAFSGAADRAGYVRAADGGTLFLDEISSLPEPAQVALLRALQERAVTALGDTRAVPVDLRVCVASQRSLRDELAAGRFRSDLHARLLGYELRLPPLRERRVDLGYLIASLARRLAPAPIELAPAAGRALLDYAWPQNIRELERYLATALVLSGGTRIELAHLPSVLTEERAPEPDPPPRDATGDDDPELRAALAAALAEHRGNVSAVARALGKHREQVQRWIRRFGFDLELFRRG